MSSSDGFGWQLDPAVTGIHRSMEPPGALPHLASRLDAVTGPNEHELTLDVERLNVDATSYRVLRERTGADPDAMAELIRSIVAGHGKLQNPWTGSGGVLVGGVAVVGARSSAAGLAPGTKVVPLVSLIALPLRLDHVGPVDPASAQVPVRGRAVVTGRMPWAAVPDDLPLDVALTAFDVYPAAWHVRDRAKPGDHVLVLGAGHAGVLAAVAAGATVGVRGRVSVVDTSEAALHRLAAVAPTARAVTADATDPLAVVRALAADGGGPADVTLVCTSAAGCEGTAILTTSPAGTVLFFSTATSFHAAALGTDAIGSPVHLVIPNGCTPDRGGYTLDLLRANPALLDSFRHGPAGVSV
jgi:L-erythro-3,5-diaminohexanoate dehydrogenase